MSDFSFTTKSSPNRMLSSLHSASSTSTWPKRFLKDSSSRCAFAELALESLSSASSCFRSDLNLLVSSLCWSLSYRSLMLMVVFMEAIWLFFLSSSSWSFRSLYDFLSSSDFSSLFLSLKSATTSCKRISSFDRPLSLLFFYCSSKCRISSMICTRLFSRSFRPLMSSFFLLRSSFNPRLPLVFSIWIASCSSSSLTRSECILIDSISSSASTN